MVVRFNELRILGENKERGIYLDISVRDLPYYDNVYLDEIIICNQDTFNPISIENSTGIVIKVEGEQKDFKNVIYSFQINDKIDLFKDLIFVVVKTKGIISPDAPCGMDKVYSVAATLNNEYFYNIAMNYVKELNEECSIPSGFIDFILRLEAIKMAIISDHYQQAIDFYKKFFKWEYNIKTCGSKDYNYKHPTVPCKCGKK